MIVARGNLMRTLVQALIADDLERNPVRVAPAMPPAHVPPPSAQQMPNGSPIKPKPKPSQPSRPN